MTITYSGRSAPSARAIAEEDEDIVLNRGSRGDINWGRSHTDTELNPDISNSTNKRRMRELFREHDVPMPELYTSWLNDFRDRINFDNLEFPCVGRPDNHMKGRGFWLCRNAQDVRRALRGTRKKRAATHFMEYIDNVAHEYRVHIFKGKSIRISEKDFHSADRHDYTTIKPTGEVKYVRKAAKKAVEALGLDFGAVDVIVDAQDNVYVLEVNAAPGLGGTMPALYAEVFRRWHEGEWDG